MFIKVSDDNAHLFYVNSEHVRGVKLTEQSAILILAPSLNADFAHEETADILIISRAAAEYFLLEVEARSNYFNAGKPPERPLKSRIASTLRYEFPNGANSIDLWRKDLFTGETAGNEFNEAMRELIDEGVVIADGTTNRYHHAANFIPSPDPLTAAVTIGSAPPADNER